MDKLKAILAILDLLCNYGLNAYSILGVNLFIWATKLLSDKPHKRLSNHDVEAHKRKWTTINVIVSVIASYVALLHIWGQFYPIGFKQILLLIYTVPLTSLTSIILYYIIKGFIKKANPMDGLVSVWNSFVKKKTQ
jgi:magnesium-transporting ATPase (P-type)